MLSLGVKEKLWPLGLSLTDNVFSPFLLDGLQFYLTVEHQILLCALD